jgi:hypothetical protein
MPKKGKKEEDLFQFIKSLASENNCYYRIYGSVFFNHYFPEKSDVDVVFYCKEPELVLHNLKNRLHYTSITRHDYTFFEKNNGTCYNINFDYKGIPSSIMIYPSKDTQFVEDKLYTTSIISWILSYVLYSIKYLYYELKILPRIVYKKIKSFLYNNSYVDNYKYKQTQTKMTR